MKKALLSLLFVLICVMVINAHDNDNEAVVNPKTAVIHGHAHVIDADTLIVNRQKIRLSDVDALELAQQCTRKDTHTVYNCGLEARNVLRELLEHQLVTCHKDKLDIYKRVLATCFVHGTNININQYLIFTGNAVLYRNSKSYREEQEQAKQEEMGIWSSYFVEPWVWRKQQRLRAKAARETRKTEEAN